MPAQLHRAGELTAIWVPGAAHEAMRDPIRARATAVMGAWVKASLIAIVGLICAAALAIKP